MADDPAAPCIDARAFDRAEELIAALRPTSPLWAPDPTAWVFRGHADAAWRLLPSVNRRKSLRGFVDDVDRLPGDGVYCSPTVGQVMEILRKFALALNAAGRDVPGDGKVRDALTGDFSIGPSDALFGRLGALGQHHGLPTTLLDWTRIGTYAAYFAAAETSSIEDPSSRLEVWALNTTITGRVGLVNGRPCAVHRFTPPLAGNPNLHAQGGVFTVAGRLIGATDEANRVERITVDDIVPAAAADQVPGTLMRRLSLPRSEASALLRWLSLEGISGVSLFPDLDGVVRSVRERTQRGETAPREESVWIRGVGFSTY